MPQGVPPLWQPSSARSIALDGLLPLPRGVMPADLPPLVWPIKDPGDVLDYSLDLSPALAGDPTDQVATVGVTTVPTGNPGDLAVGRIVANGTSAVMWLSAGVVGTTVLGADHRWYAERTDHRPHGAAPRAAACRRSTAEQPAAHRRRRDRDRPER